MEKTVKKDRPTFAKNVILKRFELSISAIKLAELADIPYPTLRDIEAGASGGRQATKEKIAKALKTTVDELNTPRIHANKDKASSVEQTKATLILELMQLLPALDERELRFIRDYALGGVESDDVLQTIDLKKRLP